MEKKRNRLKRRRWGKRSSAGESATQGRDQGLQNSDDKRNGSAKRRYLYGTKGE